MVTTGAEPAAPARWRRRQVAMAATAVVGALLLGAGADPDRRPPRMPGQVAPRSPAPISAFRRAVAHLPAGNMSLPWEWLGRCRIPRRRRPGAFVVRVPIDRAGHASRAAPAAAEFATGDAHDLDSGLLQPGVGLHVALVRDGQARPDREGVVAVVPLLALGGHGVQPGVDHPEPVDLHRV